MGNILKFDVDGWSDLDITLNGEAVLNYNKEDCFILTKVRAQRALLDLPEFQKQLYTLLENEVEMKLLRQKTFLYAGRLWYVDLCSVNSPSMKFYHFCYTEQDGYYVSLQSATNCIDSISILDANLEMLFDAINFELLFKESGSLKNEHGCLSVFAIADVHLCVLEDNTLFFVGKDNYVALSLQEGLTPDFSKYQHELVRTLGCSEFTVDTQEFVANSACNRVRYCIKHGNEVRGFICYEECVLREGVVVSAIVYSKSCDDVDAESFVRFEVAA